MTDKVQKILEDVERLCNAGLHNSTISKKNVLNTILAVVNDFKEEPVGEDFEKALANEWKGYIDRGAATVDALEDNTQELAFAKGFYRGANWKEQKMMKDAIEVVIGNEWGHPRCVLTQYDLEPIGIRSKDRVKVIIIKEE